MKQPKLLFIELSDDSAEKLLDAITDADVKLYPKQEQHLHVSIQHVNEGVLNEEGVKVNVGQAKMKRALPLLANHAGKTLTFTVAGLHSDKLRQAVAVPLPKELHCHLKASHISIATDWDGQSKPRPSSQRAIQGEDFTPFAKPLELQGKLRLRCSDNSFVDDFSPFLPQPTKAASAGGGTKSVAGDNPLVKDAQPGATKTAEAAPAGNAI